MGEWTDKAKGKLEKAKGKVMDNPVDVARGTVREKIGEGKGAIEDIKKDLEPRE